MTEHVMTARQRQRSVLAVTIIVFVDALGFSLVLPILPVVATSSFGASQTVVGLLIATFALFQLFSAPILGRLSDVHGRRPVLLFTLVGAAVGFLVMASAQTVANASQAHGLTSAAHTGLGLLFLARAINGLTGGNLPVAQAYLVDVTTPGERAGAMGGISTAFALAYGIGPLIGGHLAANNSLTLPALAGMVIALCGTLLCYFMLPEPKNQIAHTEPTTGPATLADIATDDAFVERPDWSLKDILAAMRHRVTGVLLMQWFLFILCFSMFAPMFSLIANAEFGLDIRQIGWFLSGFAVLAILWQVFLLRPLSRTFGEHRLANGGLMAFLASFVILAISGTRHGEGSIWLLLVLMLLFGLGFAAARPALTSALSNAVHPSQAGGIMGVSQSLDSLATVIGPIIAGGLLEQKGVGVMGIVASVFTASAVILPWLDRKR